MEALESRTSSVTLLTLSSITNLLQHLITVGKPAAYTSDNTAQICPSSAESAPLRDLVKSTSKLILENGGAVRGVQYWGQRRLPQRARRHQQYHSTGDYWLMHFDTNAPVLKSLNDRLRADPRVIKWTALKLGDKLDQITPKATSGGLDSNSDAPEARALFGGKTMRYGWQ